MAQSISAGFKCYFNPETLEIEGVPENMDDYGFSVEEMDEDSEEAAGQFEHISWNKCITIEAPDSNYSFRIMEATVKKYLQLIRANG
jgi:hypothetical protein